MRPRGKYKRKRGGPGGERGYHKLTWDDVGRIRELREATQMSYDKIAGMFGVKGNAIREICLRMTWVKPGEKKVLYRKPNGKCRGEQHPNAKLTEAQVREMRRRFDAGEYKSVRALAMEFGINRTNCVLICNRATWKGVK